MPEEKSALVAYWSRENRLLREKGLFDYTSRKMFNRYLPGLTDKMVLDVGCGQGMMMEFLAGSGNTAFGMDITTQSVRSNKTRGLVAIEADARHIPFADKTFDLVYSLGVIEHFSGTEKAFQEQVRVCKPGGTVVAVVPNLITPYCVAGLFFNRFTRREHKLLVTYGKTFSKKQLMKIFQAADCEQVRIEPYYGSAFLRVFFNTPPIRFVDFIEDSFISKYFGLVLWGMGHKRSDT